MNAQPEAAGRTAWARNLAAPVRDFLTTETGGAVVLLGAALAALLWANSPWPDSYECCLDDAPLDPASGTPGSPRTCGTG